MTDLPKWKCHKEVQAGKINSFGHDVDGPTLFLDVGTPPVGVAVRITKKTWDRFLEAASTSPDGGPIGGYYVRYTDGYESWSPAKSFEGGYTRMEG